MDEMHRQHLDREDTEYLCQLVDSGHAVIHVNSDSEEIDNHTGDVLHTASVIQSPDHHVHSHTSSLTLVNALTLEAATSISNSPQEANPERSLSPLQLAAGRATRPDAEVAFPTLH